jgi:hypothetical protein
MRVDQVCIRVTTRHCQRSHHYHVYPSIARASLVAEGHGSFSSKVNGRKDATFAWQKCGLLVPDTADRALGVSAS